MVNKLQRKIEQMRQPIISEDLRSNSNIRIAMVRLCTSTICAAIFLVMTPCLFGQLAPQQPGQGRGGIDMVQRGQGFQLYSVSLLGTAQLLDYGNAATNIVTPGILGREWRTQGGVSAGLGVLKAWKMSSIALSYFGSYTRQIMGDPLPQQFHNVYLNYGISRKLAPRWTVGFGLNSNFQNLETYLVSPRVSALAGSTGATFDSLLASLQSGAITPDQFAAQSGGATTISSRANPALYGRRVLDSGLNLYSTFQKSPRTSYNAYVSGWRADFFGNSGSTLAATGTAGAAAIPRILSHTTSGSVGVAMSHTLTSRTTLGVSTFASRFFSSISDAYFVNTQVNLGHTIRPWWYVQARGGVGKAIPVNTPQTANNPQPVSLAPSVIGGATMAFQGYAQTLAFDAMVTTSDPYAIGADRSLLGSVSWGYHRLRSRWSLFAYGWESNTRSRNSKALNSWRASAGISEVITNNLLLTLSGDYSSFNGNLLGLVAAGGNGGFGIGNNGFRGATISLTWTPTRLRW